jgi:hypothetical protein
MIAQAIPNTFSVPLSDGRSLVLPVELLEEGRAMYPDRDDKAILSMIRSCPPIATAPADSVRNRLGDKAYEALTVLYEARIMQVVNGSLVNIQCPNCLGDIREGGWFALFDVIARGPKENPTAVNTQEVYRVPCPVCAPERRGYRLPPRLENCGIDPQLARDLSDPKYKLWQVPGRRIHEDAVTAVLDRARRGQKLGGWLTLASPYGTGKTRLVEWLVVQLNMMRLNALFVSPLHLSLALKDRGPEDDSGLNPMLRRYLEAPVLVVDNPDLMYHINADGNPTYTATQAGLLLNERYISREYKMTIFTINTDPRFPPANNPLGPIYNRMLDGTVAIIPEGESENVRLRLSQMLK